MTTTTRPTSRPDHSEQGRVGQRMPSDQTVVLVATVPKARWWWKAKQVPVNGYVVDLSVTGANLYLRDAPPVLLGQRLPVRHATGQGTVVVRQLDQWAGGTRCGVEFEELDPGLREHLYHLVAGERAQLDWFWTLAR